MRFLLCAFFVAASSAYSAELFDIVLTNGRIVDGTGSPWYVADVGIRAGRIAKIGRLADAEAPKKIDVKGLIVAPGFIDMMGQTVTPMIDKPEVGLNLITQGITTILAGEGSSGAPLSDAAAKQMGWKTMAEYFHIVELSGLPVNVAQTVGHTQVRRLAMGEEGRKPTEAELNQMKAMVREAMEAGAIGVSTSLIYPPAVYADTDEIGALAAVAGEFGGRYFTHMRNEGDRLLEAIDEAIEIGRKGRTPVHIFHLKTAGRGNWSKMDGAVKKIRDARAQGTEVTADIYPYINNGLGIEALVHPRHFEKGREAFVSKLNDPELRKTIRDEMESDQGEWENWYKHIGRDWNKLIIGKSNSLRHKVEPGSSLAGAAKTLNLDPWELFYHLVGTGAFVMPETMSEDNKRRLIGEDFISFCTDVGPAGGSGIASHPRAYGSFPRLLSRYIRQDKAATLERFIAQASALGANEVMARDRGRIAEGLAADVIIFDEAKVTDHADFANPAKLSEGMKHVIVNGQLVLEDGKQTKARPGRVLRGPGWRKDLASSSIITGDTVPELTALDRLMAGFMAKHSIPGASLSVTDGDRLVYARGFGYADVATREKVQPESLFRIASISKPLTAVAIMKLVEEGKLSLDDKIFDVLDHYDPPKPDAKMDPRLKQITIRQCLQHTGGWDRDKSFDAMFRYLDFAKALDLPPPADQKAIIRNMMAQPLDFDPGSRQLYSNYGFCLLGRAIEKRTGLAYDAFVRQSVLEPLGARTLVQGHTLLEQRQPNEVHYYTPLRGQSVFANSLGTIVPSTYGCWNLEAMDSHGAWIASCVDLARFATRFESLLKPATVEIMKAKPPGGGALDDKGKPKEVVYVCGLARRETPAGTSFSHGGSLPGTSTLMMKRPDGRTWTVLFNTRSSPQSDALARTLQLDLDKVLDSIRTWPKHDLFGKFPQHVPSKSR
ncbi:serine hydrolase [Brevifollis gellanilyticus]|uniref:D-aminoacylase n=1 Tax=Brevifollis gellanilyticus TaxID=748831 RepID=A0A512M9S4_9BACT|nr:serine hydrolase [Brevifollis gellanilyticus]GEP43486.1 D-aminoacylase [Brevifollis gellanilyticus]